VLIKLWAKCGTVTLLSILLLVGGIFSYQAIQQSNKDIHIFLGEEFPRLERVQQFRSLLRTIESSIYHLYATADGGDSLADGAIFLELNTPQIEQLLANFSLLKNDNAGPLNLDRLDANVNNLVVTAKAFAHLMDQSPIEWDSSRITLTKISTIIDDALIQSELLIEQINSSIRQRSSKSLYGIKYAVWIVTLLSSLSVLVALVLTRTNSMRLKAIDELDYLAYHDPLTGLGNRRQFLRFINKIITTKPKKELYIAFIEIAHFRRIESISGKDTADEMVEKLADIFNLITTQQLNNEYCQLAHIQASKFGFALYGDLKNSKRVLKVLKHQIKKPIFVKQFEYKINLNIGFVQQNNYKLQSVDELLRMVDSALMDSKKSENNKVVGYDRKMDKWQQQRNEIENALEHAIEKDEFHLVYQPKLSLDTGTIEGAEILLRWDRGIDGLTPPDIFIPIAEESGKINVIGEWVLEKACTQAVLLNESTQQNVTIAVNVSAVQLLQRDFIVQVSRILEKTKLLPELLEIEITESAALVNFEEACLKLSELREIGIKLSLDDFGTGHSSLNYLHKMPINSLKIDKSFTEKLTHRGVDTKITQAVINLAHDLGLNVIAEGVETEQQLSKLSSWGCEQIQGYLLSKPLHYEDFKRFYKSHNPRNWASNESKIRRI